MNCPTHTLQTLTGAQLMIRSLVEEGVTHLFGYPGGAIIPFYDALVGSPLTHILTRHEQGAIFAADGYARATGKVGVCVATSGPGATNLVTGLANAYLDSIPMVAITGQVNLGAMGTDAFQEVDTVGITLPVVKHSFLVERAEDLPRVMQEAFQLAKEGRPGPVLIDVPKDVQLSAVPLRSLSAVKEERAFKRSGFDAVKTADVDRALTLLRTSKKPILYAGGGIVLANSVNCFREFLNRLQTPVVSTLKALGAVDPAYPYNLGMLGMHGTKEANLAVQECDLLVAVGARFDDRVTGLLAEFAPQAKVIHFDVDEAEVGKRRMADVALVGDLKDTLGACLDQNLEALAVDEWRTRWRSSHGRDLTLCSRVDVEQHPERSAREHIDATHFLRALSDTANPGTVVTCDVGQHQMWVALHYSFSHPREHLSSSGLGAMGYGLPAAVGAQLGCPDKRVINISGDGSVMMNIQELVTCLRYDLPVRVVVMDNQRLGMVRQWQDLFNDGRESEVDLSDNPDFVQVARAFGMNACSISYADEIPEAVHRLHHDEGPLLVHVCLEPEQNVWPFVPPGQSNTHVCENENHVREMR